ncbi:ClpP/crotonase-like domain-containing protein [Kickxella alabastrina]|uniref:ClpP/crotonase-like domain-containing protein n=1 Tax=Kickxella alabastrina TaxID=61397 RepID=UPI00221E48AE|nr:ClpP/crotonase-like domain-containing protein [Kickxella alabastrina]KAI7834530.1 ClpP/crotonase-like domain-containing protein [Kickxella alabastrina]
MSLIDLPHLKLSQPLSKTPGIFLLELAHSDENRFTIEFVQEITHALDRIDEILDTLPPTQAELGGALITTSKGKFYSNGLAIEAAIHQGDAFYLPYMRMLARILTFRVATVAAINGHAFAGGCMFALAHDVRVMRSDKGWMAMNEIQLGIPLIPGMAAIVRCKINKPDVLRNCVIAGKKFTAQEAVDAGFVDRAVSVEDLDSVALKYAEQMAPLAKGLTEVMYLIKAETYRDTVELLLSGGTNPAGYIGARKLLAKL